MQEGKTDREQFAPDKPKDCVYCYFWNKGKGCCTEDACYYLLSDGEVSGKEDGDCGNCPYGRHSPCIGYCLQKILLELRKGNFGNRERR